MKFNRFASSRAALGLFSAALLLGAPAVQAQESGLKMSSTVINFPSGSEFKTGNAAEILGGRLQVRKGVDELRSAYLESPGDGLQVQRFHQYFKGLRVSHGSYSVASKNGNMSFAFGKYYNVPAGTDIAPKIDLQAAIEIAKKEIGAEKYVWDSDPTMYPTGSLELCQDFKVQDMTDDLHLAWVFDVYADVPLSGNRMYIDAQTGKLLLADAIIKHTAATGSSLYSGNVSFQSAFRNLTYVLYDSTRGGGVATYDLNNSQTAFNSAPLVSSTTTSFSQQPAVDAHWGASMVYDYWKSMQNRLSYDGLDSRLNSYVHYGSGYDNAFWGNNRMTYGDGSAPATGGFTPLTALDVCAHEIGHGVCQYTAALTYSRESGAMNEGFSDIWGAVIEHYADPHETDAVKKDMWLIGEELGNTMRSMRQPKTYSQPNTYQGLNWWNANAVTCNSTLNDNCGVHYNSGVLNYWFYLLTEGGSGTNDINNFYKVSGIGINNAARIAYATELVLNANANYASARVASINAATTIFGACSKEVETVTRAWYAVGVGADYNAACAPQIAFEAGVVTTVSENISVDGCKPSKLITIPVVMRGSSALSGDSATVTATVVGGNAVPGVDYDLTTGSTTFTVGGAVASSVGITVYDNGLLNASKYIDLKLSLTARGSNASLALLGDSIRVNLVENEAAPDLGGSESHQVLISNSSSNVVTPFAGASLGARSQYIYRPFELTAAGLRPNVPVTSIEFYINGLYTTKPYYNYTVQMGNSQTGSLNGGYVSGLTTVYSDSLKPVFGWNQLALRTPFVWNGVDNVVVEVCFANASVSSLNDRVAVVNGPQFLAAYSSSSTSAGCGLPFTAANLAGMRPMIMMNQNAPGTSIETAAGSTRTWNVPAARQAYFNSVSNDKLMVGVNSATDSLGCITATITAAGNGAEYSKFTHNRWRTRKEYTLSESAQRPSVNFDGTLFFTNDELGTIDPSSAYIMYTTASDDYQINASNSRVIRVDEVIRGVNYKGFRGAFTGFGRYFLINENIALNVGNTAGVSNELWTGENPFSSFPVLHWNLSRSEQVSIRLIDVTGKTVYSNSTRLDAGSSKLELRASSALAPGTYVLQVVRPGAVFTRQLVKQ